MWVEDQKEFQSLAGCDLVPVSAYRVSKVRLNNWRVGSHKRRDGTILSQALMWEALMWMEDQSVDPGWAKMVVLKLSANPCRQTT